MLKIKTNHPRIVVATGIALPFFVVGISLAVTQLAGTAASIAASPPQLTAAHKSTTAAVNQSAAKAAATITKPVTSAAIAKPIRPSSQTQPAATATPLASAIGLYSYPASNLAVQASAWSASHPADASAMVRLAAQPIAQWFGGWNANITADANTYVTAAASAGKLPVLVAYNIPNRDCGGASAGGAASDSVYQAWINGLAVGIGQRRAIVILEPDALAASCYTTDRAGLLAAAVQVLAHGTRASIYLDAGNPSWQPVATMAARLQAAGIAAATGFSLNVSNFQTTASNVSYGTQLSQASGGKHFVIDTSRNGAGPTADNQWCNPAGRAFGNLPTLSTGQPLVDAYLWIKTPAESDGACGPNENATAAPAAGVWWPQYAEAMFQASGWQ